MTDYLASKLKSLKKALLTFKNAFRNNPNQLEIDGTIKRFEYCFELSWKVMKIYLTEEGFTAINSPRSAIKQAFVFGLINNENLWLQILYDRNLSTHTYDENKSLEIYNHLEEYYDEMKRIYDIMVMA